jgi:hypothetical protein
MRKKAVTFSEPAASQEPRAPTRQEPAVPQEPASASGGLGAKAETEPLSPVAMVADEDVPAGPEEKKDDAATMSPNWEEGVEFGIQKCWGAMTSFFQLVVNQLDQMSPLGTHLSESFLSSFWTNLEKSSHESLKLFEEFETSTQCSTTFLEQKGIVRGLVERIIAGHGRFLIQLQVR